MRVPSGIVAVLLTVGTLVGMRLLAKWLGLPYTDMMFAFLVYTMLYSHLTEGDE